MNAQLTLFGFKLRSSISAPALRRENAGDITRAVLTIATIVVALDVDFGTTVMRGRFYLDTVALGCPFCMTMMEDGINARKRIARH